MGSFHRNCEIIELKEDLNSVQHSQQARQLNSVARIGDKDQKAVLTLGSSDPLESDLNKLFAALNLKTSFEGLSPSHQVDAGLSRKNAQKQPLRANSPRSWGLGISEPVTIKQALRGLCISQASEMAATRRVSKPPVPGYSGVPDAGRIKTTNKSFANEPSEGGLSLGEGKEGNVKFSQVPEKSAPYLQVPKIKLSSKSATSSPRATQRNNTVANEPGEGGPSLDEGKEIKVKISQLAEKRAPYLFDKMPQPVQVPKIKVSSKSATSSPAATPKIRARTTMADGIVPASIDNGSQASKTKTAEKEKIRAVRSPSLSNTSDGISGTGKNAPCLTKLPKKALSPKPVRKAKLQTASSSSSNSGKVAESTRNTQHVTKPVLRNKSIVKKKSKQDFPSNPITSNGCDKVDSNLNSSTNQLVCQRCQCTLNDVSVEPNCSYPVSNCPSTEIKSVIVRPDASESGITPNSCNSIKPLGPKANNNSKAGGKFSQSSKSSLGENSSSTSISAESNLSRPSFGIRPHMSKDVRWKAIRRARLKHRVLGLEHFNLLKKLGCGDIGTVYLAELVGSNCLFAIKVMDNEYLEKRKKMPRSQTEREILRILDHPFLPTLYTHFTSDNLSCLVMEYCPGGDLHVLRQRQPGRSFPEQAARFYVAEVLLALEYLHMLGVVYRDLKPENILVREDGHIMLTDFDLSLRCSVSPTLLKSPSPLDPAKMVSGPCARSSCIEPFCIEPSCQVPCFSPRFLPAAARVRKQKADAAAQVQSLPQLVAEPTDARSNSFVGTHEYLAPEIIKGEGHGSAVDWWTLGIFLYELLYGRTPFKGRGNEETLVNVVSQSLKFPSSSLMSFQAKDLIRGLLMKDPENRLGSERGAAEIKQHPFFEGLNWALIRCAVPPEIPEDCDFGIAASMGGSQQSESNFLEYGATGDRLEFELF